jgi:hypothetical protein
MRCATPFVVLTVLLASLAGVAGSGEAAAAPPEEPAGAPPTREAPEVPERNARPIRAGAIAGFGFPRPIAVEGLVALEERVALGVEYGALPTVTVSDVDVNLWSLAGDARLFPFASPLFVGVRAGRQHIGASTSLAPLVDRRAELGVDAWYVNPRIGILWTSKIGLTLGVEAGVQIPFASSVTTNVPSFLGGIDAVARATDIASGLGKRVIPTVDLLRVGFMP